MNDEPALLRLHPGRITDAASVELEHVPVDPDQVVAGAPTVGHLVLDDDGGRTIGVWEMSVGAITTSRTTRCS